MHLADAFIQNNSQSIQLVYFVPDPRTHSLDVSHAILYQLSFKI